MTEPQDDTTSYLDALEPAARSAFGRASDLAAISSAISLRRIANALEQLTKSSAGGNVYGRAAYGYDPSNSAGGGGSGNGGGVGGTPNTTRVTVGPGGSDFDDSPAARVGGSAADPRSVHRVFCQDWQDCHGGGAPVAADTPVEVRFRDGGVSSLSARSYSWMHGKTPQPGDIVAWRLAR